MDENDMIRATIALLREHSEDHDHILIDNPDIDRLDNAATGQVLSMTRLIKAGVEADHFNAAKCLIKMAYVLGYKAGEQAAKSTLPE
jgi:hypothetical protein